MRTLARVVATSLLAVILAGTAGARERAELRAPQAGGPQEVEVVAVMVDEHTKQPTLVLAGKRDRRQLRMAIGLAEATGIAVPIQGITPPRPLTHDLFLTLFGRLKVSVTRVVITDLRDGIYYASLHLASPTGEMVLDSRPSDAVALAMRAKAPVLVEDRVFDKTPSPGAPERRPHI